MSRSGAALDDAARSRPIAAAARRSLWSRPASRSRKRIAGSTRWSPGWTRAPPAAGRATTSAGACRDLSQRFFDGVAEPPVPVSVRWSDRQQRRWGSCTPAEGTIRLSRRLEGMPTWVLDYVLVHELAHLLVPDHSRRFWEYVERYPLAERAKGFLMGVASVDEMARRTRADRERPADAPGSGVLGRRLVAERLDLGHRIASPEASRRRRIVELVRVRQQVGMPPDRVPALDPRASGTELQSAEASRSRRGRSSSPTRAAKVSRPARRSPAGGARFPKRGRRRQMVPGGGVDDLVDPTLDQRQHRLQPT